MIATQELNRCLAVVRAAARRSVPRDDAEGRPEANVRLVSGVVPIFPLHRQSS